MSEPNWKARFRAPVVMFPTWAHERPDRLLYLSNAGGKFEVYAWDEQTGERRQVTDRSEGTGYRVASRLDPLGEWIWWFDDENRLRELRKPFEEYRYDAGHGSLVVDERIKQVGMQIEFVAKHLGTTSPRA